MFLYWLTRFIFGSFARVLLRLKVEGLANLPQQGGFILASNHASSLDPFVLIAAIPRYIRWLVIYEYFDLWYLNWLLKRMNFIRVENSLPRQAFRTLLQGGVIGVFPEGRRCEDGHLGLAKSGAVALARRTARPVVPVAVVGSFKALPRTRKYLKLCPVTVRIGKPLFFPKPVKQRADNEAVDQKNTQKLMHSIEELLRQ